MHDFTFYPGPRIIAGAGKAQDLAGLLPDGPCLFVTDEQLVSLGLTEACREALAGSGREPILFSEVEADPSRATLERAVEAGRSAPSSGDRLWRRKPDGCRQARRLSARLGRRSRQHLGGGPGAGSRLALALVPTTAGTGSEATPISIITCEGGVKMGVVSRPLVADGRCSTPA
jgi:alcohol dehydrogenase class IV